MKFEGHAPVRLIAGIFVVAMSALPQAYTVSARPGAINYTEGTVALNGKRLANDKTRPFLLTGDALTTEAESRAEVLLTPGIFLRVGQNSQVKMISPRLTDTRVELANGEAIVEVAEINKDNHIQITDGAATVRLEKVGVYRFVAGSDPSVQVMEGKASVDENGQTISLGRGKEVALEAKLKPMKFNRKEEADDELLAWSKVRDEYVSAASYASAKNVGLNSYGYGYGFAGAAPYYSGFSGWYGPGWAWNSGFNCYAWLPGDGAFFSPFGYGYYSPGVVAYAPVVWTAVGNRPAPVPINPVRPPNGTHPARDGGLRPGQPGWHPGTWTGIAGGQPVGSGSNASAFRSHANAFNGAGHVSSASISSAHGSVGHAMSSGGGGFGGNAGAANSGGSSGAWNGGSGSVAHSSGGISNGGGHAMGGGGFSGGSHAGGGGGGGHTSK